ncbi:hypothetical protein ABMJ53_002467 [Escherichia coli]
MSGKPAARQGDMTQYGGSIVQGSAGVRIGAPTGVYSAAIFLIPICISFDTDEKRR